MHFRDAASGAEQWVSWSPPFDSRETWDDPCKYYAGDPSDVILDEQFASDSWPILDQATQQAESISGFNDGLIDVCPTPIDF